MCRLTAYIGEEVILADILVTPVNSLINQSICARESRIRTNGDGFGVGWYTPDINNDPALFASISPAWNDRNLLNLAAKIKSPCFFGHVRAANSGGVTHYNCHPFVYKQWMMMHNGGIHDFNLLKRHLRRLLDDDIYNWIKGETDSEHIFALFLQLSKGRDLSNCDTIAELFQEVFHVIHALMLRYGSPGNSGLNICLTDGKRLYASRYCSDKRYKPASLYVSTESFFLLHDTKQASKYILISSEKLNDVGEEWHIVPKHQLFMCDENLTIQYRNLT